MVEQPKCQDCKKSPMARMIQWPSEDDDYICAPCLRARFRKIEEQGTKEVLLKLHRFFGYHASGLALVLDEEAEAHWLKPAGVKLLRKAMKDESQSWEEKSMRAPRLPLCRDPDCGNKAEYRVTIVGPGGPEENTVEYACADCRPHESPACQVSPLG